MNQSTTFFEFCDSDFLLGTDILAIDRHLPVFLVIFSLRMYIMFKETVHQLIVTS